MTDIIWNTDDKAWFKANYTPDRPLGRFFADIEAKMMAHALRAIQPGDTEFEKGMVAGMQEILGMREYLTAPDTKDTGGEG